MAELTHFFGLVICVFYNDHGTPHVFVRRGRSKPWIAAANIAIADGALINGDLASADLRRVRRWLAAHRAAAQAAWDFARVGIRPGRIAPTIRGCR
mgnify:CR=1 FL=1